MHLVRTPLRLIRTHLRAYLTLNIVIYGLLIVGLVLGTLRPELTAQRTGDLDTGGQADLVRGLLQTPWLLALMMFAVNLLQAAIGLILVPSLIVPFSGIAIFAYFSLDTGLTLAPTTATAGITLLPHSLTLLIEFQAYILAMFGAYLLAVAWLRPASVGAGTHRGGYLAGLKRVRDLLLPIVVMLAIGAAYEAFSLSWLTPLLLGR